MPTADCAGMKDGEALPPCRLDGTQRPQAGETLLLHAPPGRTYLFDGQGRALPRHAAPEQRRAA
jgi:hypothetical protein